MAKPTQAEIVRQLEETTVALRANLANCEAMIERLEVDVDSLSETRAQHHREIAVLQTEVANLKSKTDEIDRRRWTLVIALISAAIGGAFAFAAQFTARALIK